MQRFLDHVAEKMILKYGSDIEKVAVVFPNRRAGIFFRDALSRQIKQPLISPQLLTYEEFVSQLSSLKLADRLTLVHTLFDVYRQVTGFHETFDRFFHWGEMLLHDFNEIDKWQVNAKDLFSNLKDIKALEAHFDYLTSEQIEVIARFWHSFEHSGRQHDFSSSKEQFISLWSKLYDVYTSYKNRLKADSIAYQGMITREIAELAEQQQLAHAFSALVFVGFNAFSRAEEKVVSWFIHEENADIYWDADASYVEDKQQEAGTFFRKYLTHKVLGGTFPQPLPHHFNGGIEKKMQIIAATLEVGQAKKMGEILSTLAQQKDFNPEKTVVVLPDEHLLFPVLHSIPDAIRRINVTMGYPLRKTPLYSLMEDLLRLQEEKRYHEKRKVYEYHYTAVLSILKHPYLVQYRAELSFENVQQITRNNKVFIRFHDLKGDHILYPLIFRPVEDTAAMFDYLQAIIAQINELVHEQDQSMTDEDSGEEIVLPNVEQELIYHFYIHLSRLKTIVREHHLQLSLPVFTRLFRQVLDSVRVPFTGEPLRGLQIMGVLETRNLDFENVFILSMNEGVYPPTETGSSFIPGSLRKGFGLPNQDYQDAIYAYTFFRLLQKARNVYCFYNTEDTSQLSGEPSRFLYQLIYESDKLSSGYLRYPQKNGNLVIRQNTLAMPVHAIPAPKLSIAKSHEVKKSLGRYLKNAGGTLIRLTPSALNTYLDCRLKFYFKYVAGMEEVETLQAEVDPAVFGNILHKTMEMVYRAYIDSKKSAVVGTDVLQVIKKDHLQRAIAHAFREHFRIEEDQEFAFEGKNLIVREIITKMAVRILELDAQYAPFEIIGLEQKDYCLDMELYGEQGEKYAVSLQGIIDRIDRKDNIVRVLDYKTGRDEKNIISMASLFDRQDPKRNKAALQAMFYALLYEGNKKDDTLRESPLREHPFRIVPGLINAKNIFEDLFDPGFTLDKNVVRDFASYKADFINELEKLLRELFDEKVPFDQTDDHEKCSYCPYASICF